MFTLLRLAFWGSLLLLVVPINSDGSLKAVDLISPVEAASTVRDVVTDLSQICDRNPDMCDRGRTIAATLGERARTVARAAYDAMEDRGTAPDRDIQTGGIEK